MIVILAAIITAALYLSINGEVWATYTIIGLLSVNALVVPFVVSILAGFQELRKSTQLSKSEKDAPVQFLILILMLISAWHLYNIGYEFFAGVSTTTITISFLVSAFRSIDLRISEKK